MNSPLSLKTTHNENGEILERGWIYDGDGNLVCRNLPFPVEFTSSNEFQLAGRLSAYPVGYTTSISHEGTMLRLFYHENEWKVASNRKCDARESRWGGSTDFYTLFSRAIVEESQIKKTQPSEYDSNETCLSLNEASTEFFRRLDTSLQYVILLKSSLNTRLVCRNPTDHVLYHVATFSSSGERLQTNIGLTYPLTFNFSNLQELLAKVESFDPFTVQGVVIDCPDGTRVKVLHPKYARLMTLRNNNSYLTDEVLNLYFSDNEKCEELLSLFPEHREKYQEMFMRLQSLYTFLLDTYTRRYISRQFVPVNARLHRILSNLAQQNKNKQITLSAVKLEVQRFGVQNALFGFP